MTLTEIGLIPVCGHPKDQMRFSPKNGWECGLCNHEFGQSDELDKILIFAKIEDLLLGLWREGYVDVADNNEMGLICKSVEDSCRKLNKYDKRTILQLIFRAEPISP